MRAVPLQPGNRLNVLLTSQDERWSTQLPQLLEPQGVRAIRVANLDDAVAAIKAQPIHAAVVHLDLPMDAEAAEETSGESFGGSGGGDGGLKLLQVIRRLNPSPPAVVVRGRRFDARADDRVLSEALKLDAFSVLDQPVQLEQLLDTLRRLLQRYYGGAWPTPGTPGTPGN